MSDAPGLPRLLASLLGVEAPVARTQPAPPPVDARPRIPASSVDESRARVARRPPALEEGLPAPRPEGDVTSPARRPRVSTVAPGATVGPGIAVRQDVRAVLGRSDALRAAVVVAEVLGAPRALRPYDPDARH